MTLKPKKRQKISKDVDYNIKYLVLVTKKIFKAHPLQSQTQFNSHMELCRLKFLAVTSKITTPHTKTQTKTKPYQSPKVVVMIFIHGK